MTATASSLRRRAAAERKKAAKSTILYLVLIAVALVMLYPMLWLIGASFKTNAEIFSSIWFIPKFPLNFQPYIDGWITGTPYTMGHYFVNTFEIVIPRVLFVVISVTLTSYGFSRFDFPGKKLCFTVLIGTLLLPQIILRIPSYIMWKVFGQLDSYIPLTLPGLFAVDALFVFMLIQFFRSVPRDLDEAARIDGCGRFMTLIMILVPIIRPAVISIGLFTFMWTMNDFMGPLIFINSVIKYPVTIALKLSMDSTGAGFDWNRIIAMSLIGLIPSIIVFALAQRQFMDGITTGSLKG